MKHAIRRIHFVGLGGLYDLGQELIRWDGFWRRRDKLLAVPDPADIALRAGHPALALGELGSGFDQVGDDAVFDDCVARHQITPQTETRPGPPLPPMPCVKLKVGDPERPPPLPQIARAWPPPPPPAPIPPLPPLPAVSFTITSEG